MSSFFKKHKRTPAELALKLTNALNTLAEGGDEKVCGGAKRKTTRFHDLKAWMYDTLAPSHLFNLSIFPQPYPYSARSHAPSTWARCARSGQLPHVQYLNDNPLLLIILLTASELGEAQNGNNAASLTYGTMLREVARYEPLCRHILYASEFTKMFDYMQLSTFELASDAAASFREIVTRHKRLAAEYVAAKYGEFFEPFNAMLEKGNYVTRRQSLKLLSELLLDRANAPSMLKYIASVENMCLMMNLLRDDAKSIQFEAFHVFKVFVANPDKSAAITSILLKNKDKLIGYLANFQNDREDEQFTEEKAMLTRLLERMEEGVGGGEK